MLSFRRKAMIIVFAIAIFSAMNSSGQVYPARARKTPSTSISPAVDRGAARSSPVQQPRPDSKPKFPQTVIIYYGSVPKPSVPAKSSTKDLKENKQAANGMGSGVPQTGSPIYRRIIPALQPKLIFYRTYQTTRAGQNSTASSGIAERPATAVKPTNEDPLRVIKKGATLSSVTASDNNHNLIGAKEAVPDTNNTAVVSEHAVATEALERPLEHPLMEEKPAEKTAATAASGEETAVDLRSTLSEKSERPSISYVRNPSDVSRVDLSPEPVIASEISGPVDLTARISLPAASPAEPTDREVSADAVDLNNEAVHLTAEHQYTEARSFLERAVQAEPGVAKIHRNLSLVYQKLKMIDAALASARLAEKLSPMDATTVELRCELELETENSAEAVGCFRKLNSIQPLDGLSQAYFGIALFRAGQDDESIAVLQKAAGLTPTVPEALNALGIVYFNTKRVKEAAAAFKNAVEAAPEKPESRYNLALAQLSLRNKEGALSQYKFLKVGNPELAARLFQVIFSDKIVIVPKN